MYTEKIKNLRVPESDKVHIENLEADKVLENSMRYLGCVSPLLIRRTKDDDETYEVIDGVRRLKIAQKIGLEKLPCHLVTEKDFKVYKVVKNTDNDYFDREIEKSFDVKSEYTDWTVNLTKGKINLDRLKILVKRLKDSGLGYGAIAQRIGYSRSGVKKLLETSGKEPQNADFQKQKRSLKVLVTKLEHIRKDISTEQKDYRKAFGSVIEYLQELIDSSDS